MEASMRSVFSTHFKTWAQGRKLPLHYHKAAFALGHCRTTALGTHVQRCEAGHYTAILPNACRSRSCPRCASIARERWVQAESEKLLACDHYHVVFTLPRELVPLFERQRRLMVDLLFRSVRETLLTLLGDARYLGAEPGILLALHTWGRNLSHHPHLHCLVTGGGVTPEGTWRPTRTPYLLPVRVLKALYRGKFLGHLHEAVNAGRLQAGAGETSQSLHGLFKVLSRRAWHVRLKERYAHGAGVMKYLARYVRGGPIADSRICAVDAETVTFRYRDHRDGLAKRLTLRAGDFVGRMLWHLPEPHQHLVRSCGVYSNRSEPKRALARRSLRQPEPSARAGMSWHDYLQRRGYVDRTVCPTCGCRLIVLPRRRADRNSYRNGQATAVSVQPADGAYIACEPKPP